nr:MAG TPA: hypothetical protein [Crassvirales sp.]
MSRTIRSKYFHYIFIWVIRLIKLKIISLFYT